jgi:hypothetical protein
MSRSSVSDPCRSSKGEAKIASHKTFIRSLVTPTPSLFGLGGRRAAAPSGAVLGGRTPALQRGQIPKTRLTSIKIFGFTAIAALLATVFIGTTSASATALCKADEEPCAANNLVTSVHEASVGKAVLLTSIGTTECNVLFSSTKVGAAGTPQILEGKFTYTSCTLGGSSCTATEENGPAEIKVEKTGAEASKVTGEGLVHVTCSGFIDCSYNGTNLVGTGTGALSAGNGTGEVTLKEQSLTKEAGGFLCPKTNKLDITMSPLTPTYLASGGGPAIQPPTASTTAATGTKAHETTLHGSINPNGGATTYQFEYGTTTSYGSKIPASPKSVGSGSANVEVSEPLSGLTAGTVYHFRISATNGSGTRTGEDRTFTTTAMPVATTKAATEVSASEATLSASINPKGATTTYQFEYGTTNSYGSKVPATPKSMGSSSTSVEVSERLTGLEEGRLYHYRVVATNEVGVTYGEDKVLETLVRPEAVTEAAMSVNANEALLEGTIKPNGTETEFKYEYGPTTAYGSSTPVAEEELATEGEPIGAGEAVAHLLPDSTYHYRLVATSAAGTSYGLDHVLTTEPSQVSRQREEEEAAEELHYTGKLTENVLPNDFLGLMWSGETTTTGEEEEMNVLGHSGARMFRIYLHPSLSESYLEAVFRQAADRYVRILPYFETGWSKNAEDHTRMANYIKQEVEKYGPGGSFWAPDGGYGGSNPMPPIWWEIGNEPNLGRETSNPGESYAGGARAREWGEIFSTYSHAAQAGAHENNIKIILSGLYGADSTGCQTFNNAQGVLEKECRMEPAEFIKDMKHEESYDAVSLHPYVFKVNGHAPDSNEVGALVEKIRSKISKVRDALTGNNSGKKIWITELGFPVASDNHEKFPPVTPSVQAKLITASFDMIQGAATKLGIAHLFLFNSRGRDMPQWEWHCGLREASGKFRPEAWHAFLGETGGNLNWPRGPKAQNSSYTAQARRATVTALINPYGLGTKYWVKWWEDGHPERLHFTPEQSAGAGESDVLKDSVITGLQPLQKYHYIVVAENKNEEKEESEEIEFKTRPPISLSTRTLNGEPGWVNVNGHVESETPLNNTYVNINFRKKEGSEYVFKPEESTHANLYNGDYSLVNWRIGKGEWKVNVVFEGNAETPRAETGLEEFTLKNAYHIVASNSNKCLEVSYGSSENGMTIHQEPCGDGHTQQAQAFTFVPSPSNPIQYQIVNRNSGKCLDVKDVSQADGAPIQQYTCLGWGQTNQIFEGVPVSPSDTSHAKYIAQHSHKCLDITGASTADGALLEQWTCNGGSNQSFGFESVEADPVPTHAYVTLDETLYGHPGYETLHGTIEAPQPVAGQYVNVNFKKYNNATGIYEYVDTVEPHPTLNSTGQYSYSYWGVGTGDWEVVVVYPGFGSLAESRTPEGAHRFHVGDGYRFEFRQSHKCVSTSGGGTTNGTPIIQWDCDPNYNPWDGQVYSVVPVSPPGSNYFQIRPDSNTGMCLDVAGGPSATQNGAVVGLWECLGEAQTNQIWHIVELASPNNGWFAFIAKHSGRCMSVSENSTANGARFLQWDCAWAGNQQWRWLPVG